MRRLEMRLRAGGVRMLAFAGLVLCAVPGEVRAAEEAHQPHATIHALRTERPPVVDGRLTDEGWLLAEPATTFTQTDPDEGQPATERTEVRVLFDNDALYIGARLFDSNPAAVVRRLAKRDEDADADRITIYLDPMHDHLTGAFFRVSAAGVQKDAVDVQRHLGRHVMGRRVGERRVDRRSGVEREVRIPLSQLRFQRTSTGVWGINVSVHAATNETDWLEPSLKSQNGLASRMAHLVGLDAIQPSRHAQVLPYVASRAEFIGDGNDRNPFNDGSRLLGAGGVDLKWGVSSNMTLDATVNPDFGQVELDPAVVNLTAFETFFEEHRPFFLEGAQISRTSVAVEGTTLGLQLVGPERVLLATDRSSAAVAADRRLHRAAIGDDHSRRSQDHRQDTQRVERRCARRGDRPRNGAHGVRRDLRADRRRTPDELLRRPHAARNRAACRHRRDLTSVTRQLDTPALNAWLPRQATLVGGDGHWFLGPGATGCNGRLVASSVSGDSAAMVREQTLAQRYYQRPDAPQVSFDPTRTPCGVLPGAPTSIATQVCGSSTPRCGASAPVSNPTTSDFSVRPIGPAPTPC